MTKAEFAEKLAERLKVKSEHGAWLIDAFIAELVAALELGEAVKIDGLGTFYTAHVHARTVYNIKRGEYINVPAFTDVRLRISKQIKQKIN